MTMLLPFIDEQLDGIIWRIEIDDISDTVFLEVRNTQDKQVSFTAIDLLNGEVNFNQLTQPERWLTGIEAAYNGVLLLHHYQSATSPVHKAVVAINGSNGSTLWSNYTFAFDSLSKNGPILYNTQLQPKKLFLADVTTGASLRQFEPVVDSPLQNHIVLPDMIPQNLLTPLITIQPHGNSIHYLEYNTYRIVSLHALTEGVLNQHLYIIAGENIIYNDIMNADIQKLQLEAFIMHKNCLIYIKNRSAIKAIKL